MVTDYLKLMLASHGIHFRLKRGRPHHWHILSLSAGGTMDGRLTTYEHCHIILLIYGHTIIFLHTNCEKNVIIGLSVKHVCYIGPLI